jgi:type I restriction enzyme S subunit
MSSEERPKFKQTEIGTIPEDWEIVNLGDLGELKNGVNFSRNDFGKGFPVINVTNLFDGRYASIEGLAEIKKDTIPRYRSYLARQGDILFARSSLVHSGAGQAAMVNKLPKQETLFSGFIIRFRKKDDAPIDNEFLNYLVRSKIYREFIPQILAGTAITNINQATLARLPIIIPPLPEQESIIEILSNLDSKIELNKRMNATLEAIGQAIFKRWFVDFEFPNEEGKPYKSSGGEMVNNELLGKGIPRGWAVRELGDFIRFIKGKKPTTVSASQEQGFLPQILIDALDGMQPSFAQTEDMVVIKETDTLMVMDGASSGRVERGHKGVLGSTLAVIDVKEIRSAYVYHFLKGREEDINQNTTGTSIPHADKNRVEKYLVVVPENERITNQFETISNSILSKSINNKCEIQTLQQIRDYLLPKLMSGKIRVPIPKENVEAQ